jgi:hypothetical protein
MLLSASIITILYVHVALVLFGVLTVNGGTWRLKAPTRRTTIRDFFGQFSWGRLQHPFAPAADQPIDIKEQLEAGSADMSDGSVDRGRKNKSKSISKASSIPQISYETSSRPTELKKLGMKMLWYPSGMCDISHICQPLTECSSVSRFDPPHGHYSYKSDDRYQLGRGAGFHMFPLVHGTLNLSLVPRMYLTRCL